jgi:rare lipoprotein A
MKDPRFVFGLGKLVATTYGAVVFCSLINFVQPAQAQEVMDEVEATTSNVVDCTAYQQPLNVSDVIKHLKTSSLMCGSVKPTTLRPTPVKPTAVTQTAVTQTAVKQIPVKQTEQIAAVKHKANFSGVADFYADCFHGKRTASGQVHDRTKLTAAHRTLPFGTKLKVVNRHTGKSCVVTVNDRGPFTQNRIIDLSMAAAKELGLVTAGSRMVDCYLVETE